MASRPEFLAGLLKGLGGYTAKLAEDDNRGFNINYGKLVTIGKENSMDTAKAPANEAKNRYRNVLAYDHSRPLLQDGQDGDYINANYMPGFKNAKRYIAMQGPIPTSIVDTWRLIWQEKSECIIKVTREVEGGTLKCHKYWPDPNSDTPQKIALLGQIEVEHVETTANEIFITRKFKLRKGGEERNVTQFSYEVWPDHGVPVTTREFLSFRDACKTVTDNTTNPIVVHCSAGVGRTGTYITVDSVLDAVDSGKKSKDLDIDSTVAGLRKNRCFMVQTCPQYVFCYEALLQGIRDLLKKTDAMKTLPRKEKDFLEKDAAKVLVEQQKEDTEMAALTKSDGGESTAVAPASAEEIADATNDWDLAKDPQYDVAKALTTLESRITSLTQVGAEIDLTPASSDQIRALVQAGKALDRRKLEERKAKKEALLAKKADIMQKRAARANDDKTVETKNAAKQKATKFMQRLTK